MKSKTFVSKNLEKVVFNFPLMTSVMFITINSFNCCSFSKWYVIENIPEHTDSSKKFEV